MSKPSVSTFLAQVKQQLAELPSALTGALLISAIRLSDHLQQALDPDGLKVTEKGKLELDRLGMLRAPYAAPELLKGQAPPRDARVLVYAAGALGYELVMLRPLAGDPGTELGGPFADIIRRALSRDRNQRFRNLGEMALAIEAIQAPPTLEEEELVLAAVASTGAPAPATTAPPPPPAAAAPPVPTPPAATPVARIAPAQQPRPAPPRPVDILLEPAPVKPIAAEPLLADHWDPVSASVPPALRDDELVVLHPLEASEAHAPIVAKTAPIRAAAPPPPRTADDVRALVEQEAKSRKQDLAVLETRLEALARVSAKVAAVEQRLKEVSVAPPPVVVAAAAPQVPLARRVKELLDERKFGEAEALLATRETATDPVLQLRLGQVLAAQAEVDPARASRAEAAFRRASELDPAWALPKALLGGALLRKGRTKDGTALLRSALALDPTCAEALHALRTPGRRPWMLVAAVGGAAVAGALAVLLVAPALLHKPLVEAPAPAVAAATPVAPPAQPTPPPEPVKPTPEPVKVAAEPVKVAAEPAKPAPEPASSVAVRPPEPVKPTPEPVKVAAEPAKPAPEQASSVAVRPPEPVKPTRTVTKPPEAAPPRKVAKSPSAANPRAREAAMGHVARGEVAVRKFDTAAALKAFSAAVEADPTLPEAHRGLGMVYVLQGKNAEAKKEYRRYLALNPAAPDRDQITRLLSQ